MCKATLTSRSEPSGRGQTLRGGVREQATIRLVRSSAAAWLPSRGRPEQAAHANDEAAPKSAWGVQGP
jgi:hypothetical protein